MIVHIGTHKTGTTSFQRVVHDLAEQLDGNGVHAIESDISGIRAWCHEIPLVVARQSLDLPLRRMFPQYALVDHCGPLRDRITADVKADHESIIVSHEALSLLRTDSELEQLRDMLTGLRERQPLIVAVLREKESYLRSMRGQLSRTGMLDTDPGPHSISYLEANSWLVDYDALLDAYRRHFGAGAVVVIDYHEAVRRHGSVIPDLWSACGLGHVEKPSAGLWLNRAPADASGGRDRPRRVGDSDRVDRVT